MLYLPHSLIYLPSIGHLQSTRLSAYIHFSSAGKLLVTYQFICSLNVTYQILIPKPQERTMGESFYIYDNLIKNKE